MTEPARILLVGTFHFVSRLDMARPDFVDMGTPARQAEIASVVERLAGYEPTKVALELDFSERAAINAEYCAYRQGQAELDDGEGEQIGFRLANRLGHEQVFPVNDAGPPQQADLEGIATRSPNLRETWARLENTWLTAPNARTSGCR